MTYQVTTEVMSADPMMAVNCTPISHTSTHTEAQKAVDAARAYVANYHGPDLPRAHVGHGSKRKGWVMMLSVWRKPDGTIAEVRHTPKAEAK